MEGGVKVPPSPFDEGGVNMDKKQLPHNDFSIWTALKHGNAITRLSAVFFGLGNFYHKQIGKGVAFALVQMSYIIYMLTFGIQSVMGFITLGTKVQQEVFNESLQIYEYVMGDNSMLNLLYGVVTLFVTLGFIIFMFASVKSAYYTQYTVARGNKPVTFKEDLYSLKDNKLHIALLTIPVLGIVMFTIVPLVFMIFIAFTNYDMNHLPPGKLFTWVGLENFKNLFATTGGGVGSTFLPVLGWTIVWAIFATFTNYFLGMILAMVINRKDTKCKGLWRFNFMLSVAVPSFVSLLAMRAIFSPNGPANILLREMGVLAASESFPFWTDGGVAKIMIILINVWIGVPFTMLNHTGILQNIPKELHEAADVEGASAFKKFTQITFPYMLYITGPALITTFIGNINNFNVIFLLTGGGPDKIDFYHAGETDLLVTWLYKLTITQKDYKMGSVIGISIFLISAVSSLIVYRRTAAYKDEEAMQ